MVNIPQPQDEVAASGLGQVNPPNAAPPSPTYPAYTPVLPQPHHEPKEQTA